MTEKNYPEELEGFSNLTKAIQEGARIDWERLDGIVAKCLHSEMGILTHKMVRYKKYPQDVPGGWIGDEAPTLWTNAISASWRGHGGWSLWVDGEIPISNRKARELPTLTHFKGLRDGNLYECIVYKAKISGNTWVTAVDYNGSLVNLCPDFVEVLEVYGTGTLQSNEEGN